MVAEPEPPAAPVIAGTPALIGATDARMRPSSDLGEARRAVAGAMGPRDTVQATLAFIDAHHDALLRSCGPGHLTGSALVVDHDAINTLLLHHTKLRRWLQPGGHADGDANLAAVALREATEETGIADLAVVPDAIDVDIHEVSPPGEPAHLHYDVRFLVVAPRHAVADHNHESTAQRWVGERGLAAMDVDPGLHRLAAVGFDVARRCVTG